MILASADPAFLLVKKEKNPFAPLAARYIGVTPSRSRSAAWLNKKILLDR